MALDRLETTLAEKLKADNADETELDSLFQDLLITATQ